MPMWEFGHRVRYTCFEYVNFDFNLLIQELAVKLQVQYHEGKSNESWECNLISTVDFMPGGAKAYTMVPFTQL